MGLLRMTIGELLNDVASRFLENEALVDLPRGVRLTYREFLNHVNRLAKGFLKLGLKKGDHLALWAPNRWEWVVTQFGATQIGVVLMSIDINAQPDQLDYLLRQSDAKALVLAEGLKGREFLEKIEHLLNSKTFPELKHLILLSERKTKSMWSWGEVFELAEGVPDSVLSESRRKCHPEEVITLLYTSGTTGTPKGVMSLHLGLINTSVASAEIQRLTERDRLCLSVPLSHMFGCICIVLAGVSKGATLIIPSETFEPGKILRAIETERCTAIYGSPSAFLALMEDPQYRPDRLRSLRTGIMGGAQCPLEVMKRVLEEMGVREIVIGYGLTEASSWITETRPDDPLELRVATVGRPLPNVEVKILDPGTGEEVPRGSVGELCARGLNMKGYYKMPAATEKAIDREGWLHTGDLATMDEEDYIRIAGRLKEVIQKGGETIYPAEVEEVLFALPGVSNVQVFGVPDKTLGEEIAIWIKLEEGTSLTEEDVLRFCREKLPATQIPRYIKFVKEFPMTPVGKIQKFKMREIAAKEYGLE
ncbi:MAG: AMP-binding protein [Desulfobacterota bacterium]|nr:AMP-binding protein [Thermodesulfobacteriota bacterium]